MSLRNRLDAFFYPELADRWDSRLYHDFVARRLTPGDELLDFGAGRGLVEGHSFGRLVASTKGVDVDDAVLSNPHLDEARVMAPDAPIPYPGGSFTVVVSANVLEHLAIPSAVFREIGRVLRPGGLFLFKTPNKRHYVPAIARLTPHAFHAWVNRRRGMEDRDTFPTVYRSNTPDDIRRLASASGFMVEEISMIEGRPEYLRAFPPLYPAGIAWERLVNASPLLESFRVLMLGALRKGGSR